MITDREFARAFASFWNDTIPFCEAFVRNLNLSFSDSFARPVSSRTGASRRALVNELAFSLFEHASIRKCEVMALGLRGLDELGVAVCEKLKRLEASSSDLSPPGLAEQAEALDIARRLERYFSAKHRGEKTIRPRFPGCGVLSECEGDVFSGGILYEVKAGDRNFRGGDVRQLLIYVALALESRQYDVSSVGLINPRHGTFFCDGAR